MLEIQRPGWEPFIPWLQATACLRAPSRDIPYGQSSSQIAAACDLLARLCKRYTKPSFGLTDTVINGARVAVTEAAVIHKPFCRLLHFERESPRPQPVALVLAPLSGHHATLLRDTVRPMLPDFDVYITDWLDACMVPVSKDSLDLNDYVAYLLEFLGYLGPDIHIVSICRSTVPVLGAVSLMAANGEPQPVSLTVSSGPIDARQSPAAVNRPAPSYSLAWFERKLIQQVPGHYPGAGRWSTRDSCSTRRLWP